MNPQPPTAMSARDTLREYVRLSRFAGRYSASHAGLWATMNLSALVPGLIAARLFDVLAGDTTLPGGTSGLVWLLVALAAVQTALWLVAGWVELVLRVLVSSLLRHNLLTRLLARPGALPLPFGIGETLTRFRDDVEVAENNLDWTDELVGNGLVAAVALAILLSVDVTLTAGLLLPLVVVILAAQRASAMLGRFRAASAQAGSDVAGAIGDMLTAAETIRAAGAEDRVIEHLRRLNRERQALTVRDRLATAALEAVTSNLTGIGTGLLMLLAAGRLHAGDLTVGEFVLFVSYMGLITGFTAEVGQYLAQFRQTTVAFGRMRSLVSQVSPGDSPVALAAHADLHLRGPLPPAHIPGDARPPGDGRPPDLVVNGLTYRHPGGGGVNDVSLRLAPGTVTVVTGRVGSGKTTLLRAILGLLPAQAGQVSRDGEPVADLAGAMTPPRAAYTPQAPSLFSATLADNILLGVPDEGGRLGRAIDDAMLGPDLATFPRGTATAVGTRGLTLSGGQVQRAAVARMLARDADLLVIDDVSSALDVTTERELWSRLRARQDRTILAVSHRRAALRAADQVIVLAAGRVVASGTLAELLTSSAEMRALWDDEGEPDPGDGGRAV